MFNFDFYNPTHIVFGKDRLSELDRLIPKNAKVLVVYGGGSVEKFDTFKCKKYWQSSYTTPATYGNYNNRTTPYNNFTRTDTGKKNDTVNAEKSVGNTTTLPPTTKQKSNTPDGSIAFFILEYG